MRSGWGSTVNRPARPLFTDPVRDGERRRQGAGWREEGSSQQRVPKGSQALEEGTAGLRGGGPRLQDRLGTISQGELESRYAALCPVLVHQQGSYGLI